jgi:hypothetical protein
MRYRTRVASVNVLICPAVDGGGTVTRVTGSDRRIEGQPQHGEARGVRGNPKHILEHRTQGSPLVPLAPRITIEGLSAEQLDRMAYYIVTFSVEVLDEAGTVVERWMIEGADDTFLDEIDALFLDLDEVRKVYVSPTQTPQAARVIADRQRRLNERLAGLLEAPLAPVFAAHDEKWLLATARTAGTEEALERTMPNLRDE